MDKQYLKELKHIHRRKTTMRVVTQDGERVQPTWLESENCGDLTPEINRCFEVLDMKLMQDLDVRRW